MVSNSMREGRILVGTSSFDLPEYDLKTLTKIVTKFVENCSGESWESVALKLSRLASWEFEDYQDHP